MNSPRSKLRGITSASLRYADNKECFYILSHPRSNKLRGIPS